MTWHAHLDSLGALLPGRPTSVYPGGAPFREVMRSGSMSVELFAPRGPDVQEPHEQDELYVIATGSARFDRDGDGVAVAAGDVLFVPARMPHRFVDQSDDFATWVIFWGPTGGEGSAGTSTGFAWPVVPPVRLVTDSFVLEPLAPRHNERDHAAWMSSIDHIRSTPGFRPEDWGGDTWPYEMSADANLRDLDQHADEFARGEAFAYTVLEPATGDVIGCVYVDPDGTGEANAQCRLWVRADNAELDGALLTTVRDWLVSDSWSFDSVRFPGRLVSGDSAD